MSAQEFDKGNWTSIWGVDAIVINKSVFNNEVRIKALSREGIKRKTEYLFVGFIKENEGSYSYVSNAGCITADGYDSSIRSCLTGKFANYSLPEPTDKKEHKQYCIREVLNLTKLAPSNPAIGIFCCATSIRAVVSLFLPITVSHFLVGETGQKKSATACIPMAFFGSNFYHQTALPAEWEDTESALEDMSIFIRDAVLVIDDFIPTNNNSKELGSKAERILRGAANRTARQRSNSDGSLQHKASPGAMVAATGESINLSLNDSLLKRITFFPIEDGDIDVEVLTHYQKIAKEGVLAQFTSSLVQFLLNNREKLDLKVTAIFNKYRDKSVEELSSKVHSRVHENVASLMVSLHVLYYFAMKNDVISSKEASENMTISWEQVIQLARKQNQITDEDSTSNLLFNYLIKGMQKGKVYLSDYSTGDRPKTRKFRRLGWTNGGSKGDCIGWYDRKTKSVYIKSSEETFNTVFNLIPEGLKKQIPSQRKKFWKEVESTGGLSSTEGGRNTVRKTCPQSKKSISVYPLSSGLNFLNRAP